MQIGVLAIQGGFSKHESLLRNLYINPIEVKYERQLEICDALIIPGGESTTISKLLKKYNLINPINSSELQISVKRPNINSSNEKLFQETGIKMKGILDGAIDLKKNIN